MLLSQTKISRSLSLVAVEQLMAVLCLFESTINIIKLSFSGQLIKT